MTRRSGSFITETPSLPTTNSGGGIWPIMEASQNVGNGRWPYYFPPSSYTINNSLRFRNSASAYFNRTFGSGNRKTWTFSVWVKRGKLGDYYSIFSQGTGTLSNGYGSLRFNNDDTLFFFGSPDNSVNSVTWTTSGVFRDTSAWYHIVAVLDTTQSTSSNRFKLWVNGVLQAGSFGTTPTQNADIELNRASTHLIAAANAGGFGQYNDCYLSEMNFIDGQALTASSFGETSTTTGVWSPKQYTGSYGTNGFYLKFNNTASTTTLGYDSSGNGNNWTTNNISLTAGSTYDAMLDVPTPVSATVGNFCTWSPLAWGGASGFSATFSDGNLYASLDRTVQDGWAIGSIAIPSSGKWYFEISPTYIDIGSTVYSHFGIMDVTTPKTNANPSNRRSYYTSTGNKFSNSTSSSYGSPVALNDVVGVAVDMDSGKIWFSLNNTWQASGNPVAGTNAAFTDLISSGVTWAFYTQGNGQNVSRSWSNFGQRPFTYTPPTGFKALNTYNLPEPTIVNGAGYMAATLYTGNGTSQTINNTVNGVSFQPDLVWQKDRTQALGNMIFDSIRGDGKWMYADSTDAEATSLTTLSSFNSNGFSVGNNGHTNTSGDSYVGWQWKAGGAAVTNTAGSITSSVSVNATSGFSIATYTGTGSSSSIGHGLGTAPSMVIVKMRSALTTEGWTTWHTGLSGGTYYVYLNSTAAQASNSAKFSAVPSSTVINVGGDDSTNRSGGTYVAYSFAAITGYSSFGSYTGNGSTDGPFVYCGFRPRFVMVKRISSIEVWAIIDTSRDTYNVSYKRLLPSSTSSENTGDSTVMDILSNGFKLKSTDVTSNGSGSTYIYAAFAENPFKYSLAR